MVPAARRTRLELKIRHVRAGLDAHGRLTVWHHRLVNQSRNRYRQSTTGPEMTEVYGLLVPQSTDPKDQYEPISCPRSLRTVGSTMPTS